MRRQRDKETGRQGDREVRPVCGNFCAERPGFRYAASGLPRSARAAYLRNLRVLRAFVVEGLFRYVRISRSKRRQESSSRLGRTHFPARAQCRCNLR